MEFGFFFSPNLQENAILEFYTKTREFYLTISVILEFYTKTREKIMEASRFTRNCNFTTVLNKNDFRALCRNQRKNHGSL